LFHLPPSSLQFHTITVLFCDFGTGQGPPPPPPHALPCSFLFFNCGGYVGDREARMGPSLDPFPPRSISFSSSLLFSSLLKPGQAYWWCFRLFSPLSSISFLDPFGSSDDMIDFGRSGGLDLPLFAPLSPVPIALTLVALPLQRSWMFFPKIAATPKLFLFSITRRY